MSVLNNFSGILLFYLGVCLAIENNFVPQIQFISALSSGVLISLGLNKMIFEL